MPRAKSWPIRRKIARGIVVAAAALCVSLGTGTSAVGGTVPVVYAASNDMWDAHVKPGSFFFGNGGAPYVTQLRWASWNQEGAWATGRLWTQRPGCSPSYRCPYYSQWAGVWLSTVRVHGATRYYARMAIESWRAGKWRWDAGWFKSGFWVFPLVSPYF